MKALPSPSDHGAGGGVVLLGTGMLGLVPGAGSVSLGIVPSPIGVESPGIEFVESGWPGISLGGVSPESVGVVASGKADGGGRGASLGLRSAVFFVQANPHKTVEPIKAESNSKFFTIDTPLWLSLSEAITMPT
ncbi:MAG: hypothetical protein H7318_19370 [Oligoflexus sp.]|nr:hypothetical protein [Oligoflexus sp.]